MTDAQATIELILILSLIIISILVIVAVILQPSQRTGLIGDATDVEKREKRGAELFLYRLTIVLIILFFACAIAYGYVNDQVQESAAKKQDGVSTSATSLVQRNIFDHINK